MPDPQLPADASRAELIAYLDGELDAVAQQRVEARLSLDPKARAEADAFKRTWDLLDYLPRPEPSPDFTERTLDRVSVIRPAGSVASVAARAWFRRPAAGYAAWAAATLLALVVGYQATPPARPLTPAEIDPDADPLLTREPRVVEYLPLYLAAENLDYLIALDQSDLFSDDAPSR
jgi:anti-sigma factor RsiW